MFNHSTLRNGVIIGGGFYGAMIAIYLIRRRGFKSVTLIEKESALLSRASYNNQARIHNGYHYPRSFTTAFRSRVNFPKFINDWPRAVFKNFTKLYAIARQNSKVTSKQFLRFCNDIEAKIVRADSSLLSLFEPRLIEDVFLAEEYAFDSTQLASWVVNELHNCGVEVILDSRVTKISLGDNSPLRVEVESRNNQFSIPAAHIFNCTYSGLNQFTGDFHGTKTHLKHEITEMALIEMPPSLKDLGVTLMDGPFFSFMPFPSRQLHTLSHVRYTPHLNWADCGGVDPYLKLNCYDQGTRYDRMVRDAARYMPLLNKARYVDSLFEIKTILVKNEGDDGRPILFERHNDLPGCYSILGSKIDNMYDVIERLDEELFY